MGISLVFIPHRYKQLQGEQFVSTYSDHIVMIMRGRSLNNCSLITKSYHVQGARTPLGAIHETRFPPRHKPMGWETQGWGLGAGVGKPSFLPTDHSECEYPII